MSQDTARVADRTETIIAVLGVSQRLLQRRPGVSEQPGKKTARLDRRAALRAGAAGAGVAIGAAGLGLGAASAGPRTFEVDAVVVDPVSIVRAGSGPPQRGDFFHVSARIYDAGRTDGPVIGEYQCFGTWTAAGTDTGARDQRLTTVQYHLFGMGAIMGLINEGGADPTGHIGAVQGGTGAFAGALGTFRQLNLTGPIPGVAPGQTVFRASFDLM
jgi:hypothetical protein